MVTALPKFAGVLPEFAREDLRVDTDLINRVMTCVASVDHCLSISRVVIASGVAQQSVVHELILFGGDV